MSEARRRGGARARATRPAAAPTVGFFAPSGFLPDASTIDRAAHFFAARGWRVQAGESVFARDLRFAGPDELRAAELRAFASDPSLAVAVAARGGYGLSRILGELDYAAIAAARVPLVGYSDFTAFSLALLARAGAVSFQGPAASDFFLADEAPKGRDAEAARFSQEQFFAALSEPRHTLEFPAGPLTRGRAVPELRGRLWGGNLSMICSLLQTPYFPKVRGGILFLEDVNEPAYRVERLMLQLLHSGVLEQQKAVLLGDFSGVPSLPTDNGYELANAWEAIRARCSVPLIDGLPFGHGPRRATLPVGAPASLRLVAAEPAPGELAAAEEASGGELRVRLQYWGHPTMRTAGAAGAGGGRKI